MRRESVLACMFPSFRMLIAATMALVLALAAGLTFVARSPLPGGLINARAHLSPLNALDPDATAPQRQAAARAEELKRLLSVTTAPVRAETTETADEEARSVAPSVAAPPGDAVSADIVTAPATQPAPFQEAAAIEPAAPVTAEPARPEPQPQVSPSSTENVVVALAPADEGSPDITASVPAATEPALSPVAVNSAESPHRETAEANNDDPSAKLAALDPVADPEARPSIDPAPWPKARAEKRESRGRAKARVQQRRAKKPRAKIQAAPSVAPPRAAASRKVVRRPATRTTVQPQRAGWNGGGFGAQTTYGTQNFGGFGAR